MKRLFLTASFSLFIFLVGSYNDYVFSASIESRFDSANDGWTADGAKIIYKSSDGNPGGYLKITDTDGSTFIVIAPSKFYGNLSKFDGGFISYDVISIVPNTPLPSVGSGFGRIQILGGGLNATFDYAPNPPIPSNVSWTEYTVPMTAAAWKTTQENWEKILSNVTSMYIILEPNNWSTVGFDNFKVQSVENFIGNRCYWVHITERQGILTDEWVKMRLHIIQLDASTYVMHGTIDTPGDFISIINGTGVKRGSKIYCNLIDTHPHKDGMRDSSIYRTELNLTTLKGPFWSFIKTYNTLTHNFDQDEYISGTFIPINCK